MRPKMLRAMVVLSSVCVALAADIASACIWEYATGADGKPRVVNGMSMDRHMPRRASEDWEKKLASLAAEADFATDMKKRNDYAVALIHLKRPADAIFVLEEIEAKTPGEYVTAVNLGTAYELSGQDELALRWITEGLKRNPASHDGTEWLHVRILEAKLAQKKDPRWLETHSVFDGGAALTGTAAAPAAPRVIKDSTDTSRDAKAIIKAVSYQLGERMQFVKPPEPIVAELLFELASVMALDKSVEHAMPTMKMAAEYKPVRLALYESRKAHFEGLVGANEKSGKRAQPDDPFSQALTLAVAVVLSLFAIYFVRRFLRRRKAGTAG